MNKGKAYKRKDGRWECRYRTYSRNGKSSYKSFYGRTKTDAENKMLSFLHISEESCICMDMTIKELAYEWLSVVSTRIKESTIANYRMKIVKHIIPVLGEINCCLIRTKDIYSYIEGKLRSGLSHRYVADIVVLLKSIFRYAAREYNIRNLLDGIVVPKNKETEIKVLTKGEQIILTKHLMKYPTLSNIGVAISLFMGLRIGEVCALTWSDVDLEKRIITVRKTIQRVQITNSNRKTKLMITEPKSRKSLRMLPMPELIYNMLRDFKDDDSVFLLSGTTKPIEPRTMQYRFAKLLKNANLPSVHYHSLRHAFASRAIEIGFDVKTLSEILGHNSVNVTLDLYVHSSMERKRACMDMMCLR